MLQIWIIVVSHLCLVLWFWILTAPVHQVGSFLSANTIQFQSVCSANSCKLWVWTTVLCFHHWPGSSCGTPEALQSWRCKEGMKRWVDMSLQRQTLLGTHLYQQWQIYLFTYSPVIQNSVICQVTVSDSCDQISDINASLNYLVTASVVYELTIQLTDIWTWLNLSQEQDTTLYQVWMKCECYFFLKSVNGRIWCGATHKLIQ